MEGKSSNALAFFLSLAALLSSHIKACDAARVLAQEPMSTQFIRTSCRTTIYPALCFSSLSTYATTIQTSPMQLANTALSVTMDGAHSTSTAMKTMSTRGGMSTREAEAISDCMNNLRDSVDELKQSMAAMGHLKGKDLGFQFNSIQTWVSAALTDDNTCTDGFAGNAMNGEVKNTVRSHVVNVAQLTSNALALINALATAHSSP